MAELIAKACALCGVDLRGQKHVKNTAGDYLCPSCRKAQNSVFEESPAAEARPVSQETPSTAPVRQTAEKPTVRVVRSEPQMTIKQAIVQGAKEGTTSALFKGFSKALVLVHVIAAAGLTKKFFPETNNGVMGIIALTSAIIGIIESDLLARALNIRDRWLDSETLKSTAGILVIIGFGLAYALAIFLACIGG